MLASWFSPVILSGSCVSICCVFSVRPGCSASIGVLLIVLFFVVICMILARLYTCTSMSVSMVSISGFSVQKCMSMFVPCIVCSSFLTWFGVSCIVFSDRVCCCCIGGISMICVSGVVCSWSSFDNISCYVQLMNMI